MKNFGTMTAAQLTRLLASFPANATIKRSDIYASVQAPTGADVLTAARVAPGMWHIRALPGLIERA